MYKAILGIVSGSIILMAIVANSDTLMLKDGRVLTGTFRSGTASSIEFEADGSTKTYPLGTITSVTFQRAAPVSGSQKSQAKASTASIQGGTINPGTRLMVRTETSIVTGKVKSGDRFTAILEADLVVGGNVIASRGSTVYGRITESKKAKRVVGIAKLVIELTDIMIGGQLYPLVTEQIGYEGQRSGTLKKIALGAATGGVIDGSDGAGKGAAVGAGVAVLTKGKQIEIPAKSLIEFRITQALQIDR
jgi:hypothetical protein